jgi:hypothetical protein
MFAANGWEISNLMTTQNPGSVGYDLKERYGVVARRGRLRSQEGRVPVQHVSHATWQHWAGRFDEVFCFVRHPEDRFASALRYHHKRARTSDELDQFAERFSRRIRRAFRQGDHTVSDNHFRPQFEFISPTTRVYHLERDGLAAMCETYELLHDTGTVSNQTEGALTLTDTQRAWVNKIYDQDFTSFGYEKR